MPVVQRNVAILFCASLVVLGVSLMFRDDGGAENIAWSVPEGEELRAVAGPLAVGATKLELVGRDGATGDRRWTAPARDARQVQLVGDVVLVTSAAGGVRALDAGTGDERWSADPVAGRRIAVGSRTAIAFTQCPADDRCVVESRALATGATNWTAPVAADDLRLGSAVPEDAFARDAPVWPTNHALVPNPEGQGFNVRNLDTGAIRLTDSRAPGEALALAGDVLLRAGPGDGGTLVTGTDLARDGEPWEQTVAGTPLRADGAGTRIALADGSIVLVGSPTRTPRVTLQAGARLQTLDPASGRITATANELPDPVVELFPMRDSSGPARVPVLANTVGEDGVQFGANVEEVDGNLGRVASTADQVAWRAGGKVTVADRASGRLQLEQDGEGVFAVGDRIVFRDEDDRLRVLERGAG